MKQLITILLLIFISISGTAQADLSEFQKEIDNKAKTMEDILLTKKYVSDFEKEIVIGFSIDTFKIEKMLELRLENDFTTVGMVNALMDAEQAYDRLLNKYYQILLNKFDDDDKESLKQSQRNWIKFRDSERLLSSRISLPKYSGGGTMQNIVVASAYLDITKKRVAEINDYIHRFIEYSY